MKQEILELLNKILDSDISRDAKERILLYYMLPREVNLLTGKLGSTAEIGVGTIAVVFKMCEGSGYVPCLPPFYTVSA